MSKSIRLHKEHGLNPTMPTCFFCGKDKGEIALLGSAYKEKAPMKMCLDKEPCSECKEYMKKGIIFIAVRDGETDKANPFRTGRYFVVKEEAVKRMPFNKEFMESVLESRVCFVEDSTLNRLGFPEAEEVKEKAGVN